jgi:hypothetical protein
LTGVAVTGRTIAAMESQMISTGGVDQGTRVEVRTRFDRRWSTGFEVDAVLAAEEGPRYRIRRRSDDSVLPSDFGPDEVRSEKKGRSMWWI